MRENPLEAGQNSFQGVLRMRKENAIGALSRP